MCAGRVTRVYGRAVCRVPCADALLKPQRCRGEGAPLGHVKDSPPVGAQRKPHHRCTAAVWQLYDARTATCRPQVDASGVRLLYSSVLKPYDMGTLTLGAAVAGWAAAVRWLRRQTAMCCC
jgi:hypothetical protein